MDVPQSTTELLRLKRRLEDGRLNQNGGSQNQKAVTLIMEDGSAYPLKGRFSSGMSPWIRPPARLSCGPSFPIPMAFLLPGMFVRAVMKEGVNEAAIVIPQQAVSRDPKGNPTALIVDADDTVQQRMLALDRAIGDHMAGHIRS